MCTDLDTSEYYRGATRVPAGRNTNYHDKASNEMQKCGVDNMGRLENGQAIPTQVLDKYLGTLYMPAQWTASPYVHGQVHSVFLRAHAGTEEPCPCTPFRETRGHLDCCNMTIISQLLLGPAATSHRPTQAIGMLRPIARIPRHIKYAVGCSILLYYLGSLRTYTSLAAPDKSCH